MTARILQFPASPSPPRVFGEQRMPAPSGDVDLGAWANEQAQFIGENTAAWLVDQYGYVIGEPPESDDVA